MPPGSIRHVIVQVLGTVILTVSVCLSASAQESGQRQYGLLVRNTGNTVWRVYANGAVDTVLDAKTGSAALPSVDRTKVAFTSENDVWLLDLRTGGKRQLICHKAACVPGSQPRPGSRSTAHRPETRLAFRETPHGEVRLAHRLRRIGDACDMQEDVLPERVLHHAEEGAGCTVQ
jgi:hypothetical protein